MNFRPLLSVFSSDLAIDLGTAKTIIYSNPAGIVLDEPSVVAVKRETGEVMAVGKDAKEVLGRAPNNVAAISPIRGGVISNFEAAEQMLTRFIHMAHGRRIMVRPRVLISVPSAATAVEKRAVWESARRARASEIHLVHQGVVAALGAGLPVTEPSGSMVVDIGGGTTDISVISLSGVIHSRSVRVAGNAMDDAVISHIKRKHNLLVGERSAEQVKIEIGSALPLEKRLSTEVKGRCLLRALPVTIAVDDAEIRECLSETIAAIVSTIRHVLEQTPPEISGDISDRGIVLTGGGAMLRGLDARIRHETGLPVSIADQPFTSVVMGMAKMLENFALLRKASLN